MKRHIFIILVILIYMATGCDRSQTKPVSNEMVRTAIIYQSMQCVGSEDHGAIHWINNEDELKSVVSRIIDHNVTADIISPSMDFTRESALLIEMGPQPTAGYHVTLSNKAASNHEGVLTVTVNWLEPSPDALVAQVLTRPCTLIRVSIPKGKAVQVVDLQHKLRLHTTIKE